jgi:hypothetical protein
MDREARTRAPRSQAAEMDGSLDSRRAAVQRCYPSGLDVTPRLARELNPAAASSLTRWHEMVRARDLTALSTLLHADATFRSPMAFKPYRGAQAVALILNTVSAVFGNFEYGRRFVGDDGLSVVLEFSATVGDKSLKGVDLIRFDEEGRIVDFEVMVRPFNALQLLGSEMGTRLQPFLQAYKATT